MQTAIRRLELDDISTVVQLIGDSFEARLRDFMVYTQHGIADFMEIPLRYPGSSPRQVSLVAETDADDTRILGFGDFRKLDEKTGFLSYIAVNPEARGQGVATALIRAFTSQHPELAELQLDVFSDNRAAISLYEKLGFTKTSSTVWISREVSPAGQPVEIRSLASSLASHQRFGFCELNVVLPDEGVTIGRLGDSVLRCFGRASFENDELLSSLAQMFPGATRAFAIVPEPEHSSVAVPHQVELVSHRLTLSLP